LPQRLSYSKSSMPSESGPQPQKYSPFNQSRRSSPSSSQSRHRYPVVPPLQHPSAVHVSPTLRSPTSPQKAEPPRTHTSFSSLESGSTLGTEYKQLPTYKHFQYGPQVEKGIAEESLHRQSRSGSQQSGCGTRRSIIDSPSVVEDNSAVFQYIQEKSAIVEEEIHDDHALWVLMWMSFLDPFYCLFSAMYSILAVITIVLFAPLRLCQRQCSPSVSLVRMVAPVFRNHLRMICADSLANAHTFEFSPVCLILIHVASPFISFGNVIAAWIVAIFWIFALIMGNPDGTERRDDGRASVLALRDWWERCLLFAVRK